MLVYIFIETKQIHQNDHFIVMLSQTLQHVSAYQRHHQTAHTILTRYLYVGVHYRKNNGISSEVAPISIFTLWIKVDVVNCCRKQLAITTCIHTVTILTGANLLKTPLFFL
jgi:hypothetical protein